MSPAAICDHCRECERLGCNGHEDVTGPARKRQKPSPYGRPAWGEGAVDHEAEGHRTRTEQSVAALLWSLERPEIAGMDVPVPLLEYQFHPERRWRFDLAWPELHLAAEVDGAVWTGGHHTRGQGVEDDAEKQSTAVAHGWAVLRFTPRMIRDGRATTLVVAAIQARRAPQ